MSMCECFERVLGKVALQLKEQLPEREAQSLKAEWENMAFVMSENTMETKVGIPISYQYQKFKPSGEPHKRPTKDAVKMMMSYCPFCGKDMHDEEPKA